MRIHSGYPCQSHVLGGLGFVATTLAGGAACRVCARYGSVAAVPPALGVGSRLQQPTSVALGPTVDGWYWQAGGTQYGSVTHCQVSTVGVFFREANTPAVGHTAGSHTNVQYHTIQTQYCTVHSVRVWARDTLLRALAVVVHKVILNEDTLPPASHVQLAASGHVSTYTNPDTTHTLPIQNKHTTVV